MLDGIIITERNKIEKVIYARKVPTVMSALSDSFNQKHKQQQGLPPLVSMGAGTGGPVVSIGSPSSRRNSVSSIMSLKSQNTSIQSDYLNANIPWAESIINYVKQVSKGCMPITEGNYLVLSFMNQRLIVYTMVGSICFYAIGDETHGEFILREICKCVVNSARSACKRNPDDAESLIKHYAKLCSLLDKLLIDEVESIAGDTGGTRAILDITD